MCTSFHVSVIFVIFYISSCSGLLPSDDEVTIDKTKLKQTFDKLLHELVDVNQERLDAINRVFQLQEQYPTTHAVLRSSVEERDEDRLILIMIKPEKTKNEDKDNSRHIPYPVYTYPRSRDVKSASSGLSIPGSVTDGDAPVKAAERMAILRGWKSCRKEAIKSCTKACKSATKSVCNDHKCSSRMKKAFKKECSNSCNEKFSESR